MSIIVLSALTASAQTDDEPTSYSLTNKVVFTERGDGHVNRFLAFMPVPVTNEYQTVWRLTYNDGEVIEDKNYGNMILFVDKDNIPDRLYELSSTMYFTPKTVRTDFTQITQLRDYDPDSEACQRHLGDRGNYIVLDNPEIKRIGDQLWGESADILDYARKCYDYVASHFQRQDHDWKTLEDILKDGGGGSGDFTTLMVNLLRYKGIPARHNIGITIYEDIYSFTDFYLEGYGWIPLDATKKNEDPEGDYFGIYEGDVIVLLRDIFYEIDVDTPIRINTMQVFTYYYTTESDEPCMVYAISYLENNGVTGISHTTAAQPTDTDLYNLQGQKVTTDYKGVVISNGRKYLRK